MVKIPSLRDVRQRRKEIAATITKLQAEDAELEVAERALARLSGQPVEAQPAFSWPSPATPKTGRYPSQKPEGIPTVPQMIVFALRDAASNGRSGLEPREITDFIKKTYWPEVDINKVGPIAWRMWTRKELAKRGAKYSLKTETPAEETDASDAG